MGALETTYMNNIVKIILKFSEPCWPSNLHGMICSDKDMLIPEVWFRDVSKKVDSDEPTKAFATIFCTAEYADRVASLPKEEVLRRVVNELDVIFSQLEPQHMVGDLTIHETATEKRRALRVADLKKPSEGFLGGMFWDCNPHHHPYIGGGYCSVKAGSEANLIQRLAQPVGPRMFFAGEATCTPGATAHAALDSGERAARMVSEVLHIESG